MSYFLEPTTLRHVSRKVIVNFSNVLYGFRRDLFTQLTLGE